MRWRDARETVKEKNGASDLPCPLTERWSSSVIALFIRLVNDTVTPWWRYQESGTNAPIKAFLYQEQSSLASGKGPAPGYSPGKGGSENMHEMR
jgi:hypothetical protein